LLESGDIATDVGVEYEATGSNAGYENCSPVDFDIMFRATEKS
jgi:hypothetical protein